MSEFSPTLARSQGVNRDILTRALTEHHKHYWCLCKFLERELKTDAGRRRWISGPAAIGLLFGTGHTSATVIWETHSGRSFPHEEAMRPEELEALELAVNAAEEWYDDARGLDPGERMKNLEPCYKLLDKYGVKTWFAANAEVKP